MSVEVRHGEAAVLADVDDPPTVAVADAFAAVGAQAAVVAAGGDEIADGRGLAPCDTDRSVAKVTVLPALLLDGGVERVYVFVGLGDDGDAATGSAVVDPSAGGFGDELVEVPAVTRPWPM